MHRLVLHNDTIVDASQPCLTPGQVGLMTGWGVFSTIRVRDGVLFAWDRHVARMRRDAALLHVPFPEDARLLQTALLRLVEANAAYNSTLRVNIIRNNGGAVGARQALAQQVTQHVPDARAQLDLVRFAAGADRALHVTERAMLHRSEYAARDLFSG